MLKHQGTKIIETNRCILRPLKESDAQDMFNNWASKEKVTKYLTWPAHNSVDITKKILEMWLKEYQYPSFYQWGIELKENHQVIGTLSLMNVDDTLESCEVGYCISDDYWNKGIVTEVFLNIIKFIFEEVGFIRVVAKHDAENVASGKVMEKCGLTYEGLQRKVYKNNKGEFVDCKSYAILKEDYMD